MTQGSSAGTLRARVTRGTGVIWRRNGRSEARLVGNVQLPQSINTLAQGRVAQPLCLFLLSCGGDPIAAEATMAINPDAASIPEREPSIVPAPEVARETKPAELAEVSDSEKLVHQHRFPVLEVERRRADGEVVPELDLQWDTADVEPIHPTAPQIPRVFFWVTELAEGTPSGRHPRSAGLIGLFATTRLRTSSGECAEVFTPRMVPAARRFSSPPGVPFRSCVFALDRDIDIYAVVSLRDESGHLVTASESAPVRYIAGHGAMDVSTAPQPLPVWVDTPEARRKRQEWYDNTFGRSRPSGEPR